MSAQVSSQKVLEQFHEQLPSFSKVCLDLQTALSEHHGAVRSNIDQTNASESLHLALIQQLNDVGDLLFDAQYLRGRSLVRVARSLFEHLLTLADLTTDTESSARYLDHRHVTLGQLRSSNIGLRHLHGKALRAELHRRKKLTRGSDGKSKLAVDRWGTGFRRNWTTASIRERAEYHGYTQCYSFYRVASSVLHGAAGGSLGLVRSTGGKEIHRNGLSLYLCPIALSEGLYYTMEAYKRVEDVTGLSLSSVSRALASVQAIVPEYSTVVNRLDSNLWPDIPPIGNILLRVLFPDGTRDWILHDNTTGRVIEADAPTDFSQSILDEIEADLDAIPLADLPTDEWISIALAGSIGAPRPNASWRPHDWIAPKAWRKVGHELVLPWDGSHG